MMREKGKKKEEESDWVEEGPHYIHKPPVLH